MHNGEQWYQSLKALNIFLENQDISDLIFPPTLESGISRYLCVLKLREFKTKLVEAIYWKNMILTRTEVGG